MTQKFLDKVGKFGHCARTRARMETRERNLLPLFHIGEPLLTNSLPVAPIDAHCSKFKSVFQDQKC